MTKRNIYLVFLLTFLTLGLYNIYFMCSIQKEINNGTKEYKPIALLILFEILTLGFYYTYWCYYIEQIFKKELEDEEKQNFSLIYLSLFKPACNLTIQNIINTNCLEDELQEKTAPAVKEKKVEKNIDDLFFAYSKKSIEPKPKSSEENNKNNLEDKKINEPQKEIKNEDSSEMEIDEDKMFDYFL